MTSAADTNVVAHRDFFFFINGERHQPFSVNPPDNVYLTLLEYLRYTALLPGTKEGCGQGQCGACTCMVTDVVAADLKNKNDNAASSASASVSADGGRLRHRTVNSCITPLFALYACHVTTIEGLGDTRCPHAMQKLVARGNASQCGFCTPGMIMSLYGHTVANKNAKNRLDDFADLEDSIAGNLCRCTGYRPLLDVAKAFAFSSNNNNCDKKKDSNGKDNDDSSLLLVSNEDADAASFEKEPVTPRKGIKRNVSTTHRLLKSALAVSSSSSSSSSSSATTSFSLDSDENLQRIESCFALDVRVQHLTKSVDVTSSDGSRFVQPATDAVLRKVLHDHQQNEQQQQQRQKLQLISGNGGFYALRDVWKKSTDKNSASSSSSSAALLVSTMNVGELNFVRVLEENDDDDEKDTRASSIIKIGARCTLAEFEMALRNASDKMNAAAACGGAGAGSDLAKSCVRHFLNHLADACRLVSSQQLRWWSSVVGHLLSYGADLLPIFAAAGATLEMIPFSSPSSSSSSSSSAHKKSVPLADVVRDASRHLTGHIVVSATIDFSSFLLDSNNNSGSAPPLFIFGSKAIMRRDSSHGLVSCAVSFRIVTAGDDDKNEKKQQEYKISDAALFATNLDSSKLMVDRTEIIAPLNGTTIIDLVEPRSSNSKNEEEKKEQDAVGIEHSPAFQSVFAKLTKDVADPTRGGGGRTGFRVAFVRSTLVKAWNVARNELLVVSSLNTGNHNNSKQKVVTRGLQVWETATGDMDHDTKHSRGPDDEVRSPVGDAIPLLGALQQATGQAIYVDDIPTPAGCLHAALVKADTARGVLTGLDASAALKLPGVVAFFCATDFEKICGVPLKKYKPFDEKVFCNFGEEFRAIGEPLGLIVARDQRTADRAATLVEIQSDAPRAPAVFDIEQAVAAGSFMDKMHTVLEGEPDKFFASSSSSSSSLSDDNNNNNNNNNDKDDDIVVVRGVTREGGQEHFYMEPHALLVAPGELGEINVYSMTQCITKTQGLVAASLGIPQSRVNVIVRRIGGAFGGKEVRTTYTSAALALAVTKLKKPIRWRVDRNEDMRITGGRHPFQGEWALAGSKKTKKLLALSLKLYVNGGCTESITSSVMTRGVMHCCNSSKVPHVRVEGVCVHTNIVSNTAFRGFGANQGMFLFETALVALAQKLSCSPEELRFNNLMQQGMRMHYGQLVPYCPLEKMWLRLMRTSDFENRRKNQVGAFNEKSRWKKRGIACMATQYGCSFPVTYLNQATATVSVYADGTAVITHSATEMGNGAHTKCAQTAARALGIPLESVTVGDTAAHSGAANSSPTAASMGSDLNCMAIIDACSQIMERVNEFKNKLPADQSSSLLATTKDLFGKAYKNRVCLSATGHYATTDTALYDWNMETSDNSKRGPMYSYYTFGCAAAEVEVDVLTGLFRVVRADVLMDVGSSLSPLVDVGQVEGAFVQGFGWLTLEELVFAGDTAHPIVKNNHNNQQQQQPAAGELVNAGPTGYKIPAVHDVPIDFRVELLSDANNVRAVHGSRAVGEPPLFLGSAVFFAIREAIDAARRSAGKPPLASLDAPVTSERIRMACADAMTEGMPETVLTST